MSTDVQEAGWIQTFTGTRVWPMRGEGEIRLQDIAHALSNICRFGGHTKWHYSVAQHSWLVSQVVPAELALHGLLHDAAEAYLGDIPRPIKHGQGMDAFRAAETYMEAVIERRFGLPWSDEIYAEVKKADLTVLWTERRDLLCHTYATSSPDWGHGAAEIAPMGKRIMRMTPPAAERVFTDTYHRLAGTRCTPELALIQDAYPEDGGW